MKQAILGRGFAALLAAGVAFSALPSANADVVTRPAIVPTPVSMTLTGGAIELGNAVTLIAGPGTEADTLARLREILNRAGVKHIDTARRVSDKAANPQIVIGTGDASLIRDALAKAGAALDDRREGYTILSDAANGGMIVLAGHDGDGLFHSLQTFRQLAVRGSIPALVIQDHPDMPIRGTIEGFYGKPWTMADRDRHLDFLASVKANTYVYSPKDDPYARDRWREPYPAATLQSLGALVERARRDHIDFVYAISPGPTVCFSDPADLATLERKFDALRSIGVHRFYVALDDIEYQKWNCEADEAKFGPSGPEAAGVAQSYLLNAVEARLKARDKDALPLIMVPTEYYDAKESPYKAALRQHLNPEIVVQWTGTDVVPPAISVPDARAATKAFGRKTLLWDNYPVNDYASSAGRLLLAPYVRREAGLDSELSGILSNPMNQEAASRPAVTGVVSFAWNGKGYDPDRSQRFAARALTGGDARATAALLTLFDTQHLAPTFGSQPWQEQAPQLQALFDHVRAAIANGDAAAREAAIAELAERADRFAAAPDTIRAGVIDPSFIEETQPWLNAMAQWGAALRLTASGLAAANRGSGAAARYFDEAQAIAAKAAAVETIPGATRFGGPVKLADGVLDRFIADAPGLIAPTGRPE